MKAAALGEHLAGAGPVRVHFGLGVRLDELRHVRGSFRAVDGEARLRGLRQVLEKSGAEVTSFARTELRFRSPLSPPLDSDFPARDEFGPAPVHESSVLLVAPGTPGEAIRFDVPVDDAVDFALFWFVFLLPLFVVSPALAFATGSPLAWSGLVAGLLGNAVNGIGLQRLRSRTDRSIRDLLAASSDS